MDEILRFLGLKEHPFRITPDTDFFFETEAHREAIDTLKYLIQSGEGFAVIIGEPGTGKTITLRKFVQDLPKDVEYAYIFFPTLSSDELFTTIAEDLGISLDKSINKNQFFSILSNYLLTKKEEGKKVLVMIDEAQGIPEKTLEDLRLLSNLETDKEKLLNIVLAGQSELEEKLNSPTLRQLRQRITLLSKLRPLTFDETKNYILYRLNKADGTNIKIDDKAFKAVYRYSKGFPRVINQIMDRTLMAAFVEKTRNIKEKHVKAAAKSLDLIKNNEVSKKTTYIVLAGIFISILIGFGVYLSTSFYHPVKKDITLEQITPQKENNTSQPVAAKANTPKKFYILYLMTGKNLDDLLKKKEKLENKLPKKLTVLKVKNGKYYALALLYENKTKALSDLKQIKKLFPKLKPFVTNKKYDLTDNIITVKKESQDIKNGAEHTES